MKLEQARRFALSLPEAIEAPHHEASSFRVGGKIFATLGYPDHRCAVVMLTPQDQDLLVRDYPKAFSPVAGKWGASGSTTVTLRSPTKRAVTLALDAAWRKRAPKRAIANRHDRRIHQSSGE